MELMRVGSCCRGWARGSRAPLAWGDPRPLEPCPEPPLLVLRPLLPPVTWGGGAWGPLLVLRPLLPPVTWGGGASAHSSWDLARWWGLRFALQGWLGLRVQGTGCSGQLVQLGESP